MIKKQVTRNNLFNSGGIYMEPIQIEKVQEKLNYFKDKPVYLHLETSNGAYASHFGNKGINVGAFIRNANVTFHQAKIVGNGSAYRVGLKMDIGWVYGEGLTDWTMHEDTQLLLAGHDAEGRLLVAMQLSETPFHH